MKRKNRSAFEVPVGMYITDSCSIAKFNDTPSFWSSTKLNNYLPLLNVFILRDIGEIKFSTGLNVDNDVSVYNANTSSQRPTRGVMRSNKLDITSNDLFMGGITLCLNFTRFKLTVVGPFGIPKMYRPLESDKFQEFHGKVLFLTIHTLNSQKSIHDHWNVYNYLEQLKHRRTGSNGVKDKEFNGLIDYVINNLEANINVTDEILSNTIKVCTCYEVKEEEIFNGNEPGELYIPNKGVLITSNDVVTASPHPLFKEAITSDKGVLNAIKERGIACFIVDNENLIGERYFNFAGEVIQIPKVKSDTHANGLYIGSMDANKSFTVDNITSLDKLDENKYVYKSAEEALDGGDLKSKFMEDSELRKIIRAEEVQNTKLQFEVKYQELEEDARKNKIKHEEEIRALNLELEKTKALGNIQKHNLDTESLYRKTQYEYGKFDRDSFVETLKTIGAVAGLALGLFALYSKFSKN